MKFEELTITNTDWCFLYRIYDMKTGDLECPGIVGPYGAETADGVPYLAFTVGHDERTGNPKVTRDAELSLVYPVRVFAYGRRQDRQLTHAEVEDRLLGLGLRHWNPTLVHRGYDKGVATWFNAVKAHTDYGPRMGDVRRHIYREGGVGWEVVEDRTAKFWGNCEGLGTITLYREVSDAS